MTDLNLLTVRALRELAKKHLGTGYSRLKTKAELIAALSKVMPKEPKAAPKAATPSKPVSEPKPTAAAAAKPGVAAPKPAPEAAKPSKPVAEAKAMPAKPPPEPKPVSPPEPVVVAATPPAKRPKGTKPEEPKISRLEELASKYAAKLEPFKPLPEEPRPVFPALKSVSPAAKPGVTSPKPAAPHPASTVPVAKAPAAATAPAPIVAKDAEVVANDGEQVEVVPAPSAPPKPRVISAAEQDLLDEDLGELPPSYLDDDVTLLARDPHTLWVAWDFARQTERRAHEGMSHAVPVLRLFDGPRLAREVEISLEARSWYLYNVVPGHRYRAEIHFVAPAGKTKQLGPASNAMTVPPEGPSSVIDTHFVRLPLALPPLRPVPPMPKPHPAPPFPVEHVEALMARAERALREELPALPTPPNARNGVVPAAASPKDEPVRTTSKTSKKKQVGGREGEVVVKRWMGSSDQSVDRYRSWVAEEIEDQPAATTERTRFGGRWTSSRPA